MATITALVPSVRPEGRVSVMVDGVEAAVVPVEAIGELGLSIGREFDDIAVRVADAAAEMRAYDRALALLAHRGRSREELRRSLLRKGEPASAVESALERLVRAGLLDDASYARSYSRSKVLGPGHSRRRLRQELARRGVDREIADDAIEDVLTDESVDEEAIIERVARRKLRALARVDAETRDRRLWAFLARRGYEPDDIRRAIAKVTGDPVSNAPDDDELSAENDES